MGCPGCPGWTFEPRCKETPGCGNWMNGSRSDTDTNHCRCTGGTTYNMEIVDYVMIPEHLPSGEYVLGKREHGSSRRCAWIAAPCCTSASTATEGACAQPLRCAGWRWDCEESNQVWASCSDVTIKAKDE